MGWLVVTDLDGSLLNHFDYSFDEAVPTIDALKSKKIPVILNTSKTFSETIAIRHALAVDDPFIVENGSCIFLPKTSFEMLPSQFAFSRGKYWGIKLGKCLSEIDRYISKSLEPSDDYVSLTQSSVQSICEMTGLSAIEAEAAKTREFSQPILWQGTSQQLDKFKQRLHKHGLHTLQGGRFLHVQGITNKGLAIRKLRAFYPQESKTIVLGDSANDLDMLQSADIPVVVKGPGNRYLLDKHPFPYITSKEAPAGWSEGVQYALDQAGGVFS
jgi:mannosyl-3-phosphoglycerate phosphatase